VPEIVEAFNKRFDQTRSAFKQERVFQRARELAASSLLTLGKHTITGMLSSVGKQFQDWSATYRLFGKNRIDQKALFAPAIQGVLENLDVKSPLFTMMDDTLVRKRGRKVSGTAWKRDPLGPAFHTNFVWGQRYLQISAALPDLEVESRARGVPVDFWHAPSSTKPRKNALPDAWDAYKQQQKISKISAVGAARLANLRAQVPDREIICAVDGGFTNKEVVRSIPENTVLIGRIRKDARLFRVPEEAGEASRGRKKYYGEPLPTPEQIRQDESIPWQKITAFAAGKHHEFEVKTMTPVRWKSSKDRDMLIVIIRPLAYRPRKGAKLLYREPAYLICSDTQIPLEQLVQAYLWRWEIELNFRDEKTIMGVGEAQVRTSEAVQSAPAFVVASYAFLLLAAHSVETKSSCLPSPKWYPQKPSDRCTTQKILSLFRSQYWGIHIDPNKSAFVSKSPEKRTHFYFTSPIESAVCYAYK
jgi:SRSO17 transposase